MRSIAATVAGTVVCAAFVLTMLYSALAAEVPRVNKEELRTWIEKGDVIVVDVRSGKDWKSSAYKINTAVREDPKDAGSWAKKYGKDKKLVLY